MGWTVCVSARARARVCVCVCMAEQFAVSHMESSMILTQQPKLWTRMETRNIPYYMTCGSNGGGGEDLAKTEQKENWV
jgi:hypothetical protein